MAELQEAEPPLLDRIIEYNRRWGLAPTQFGMMAVGSPSFIANLRRGTRSRPQTVQRVLKFMAGPPPARPRVRLATKYANAYRKACDANAESEFLAKLHRQTDEFERARLYLQQRHWVIFAASVTTPGATGYMVGQQHHTEQEIIAMAKRHGWEGINGPG